MAENEKDRCWICLGGEDEAPPLAQPFESTKLINPCSCSLKAHKRCLIDWASDRELKARLNTENGNPTDRFHQIHMVPFRKPGFTGVISLKPEKGLRLYTSNQIRCPQCQMNILVSMKPSSILSFSNIINSAARKCAKYTTLSILGGTFIFAASASLVSSLLAIGLKLFDAIAPRSVQMTLLSIKTRTWESSLINDKTSFRQFSIYGGLPIFLYSLRSKKTLLYILGNLYPLLFYEDVTQTSLKDPRIWLPLLQPLREVYGFIYSLTFNRVYYRWVQSSKAFFLADRLPAEEIDEMEAENESFMDFRRRRLESVKGFPWHRKLYHWFFPGYSVEESKVVQLRRSREFRNIFTRDFSSFFQYQSRITRMLTTFLWPFSGHVIGIVLSQIPAIRSLSNELVNTPDESTYVINLLGMCISCVLKDLLNLFIAWRQVRQYQNMNIVDSLFSGITLGSITLYEPEMAVDDVLANENRGRDHLDQIVQDRWNPENGVPVWDMRSGRMVLTTLSRIFSDVWGTAE